MTIGSYDQYRWTSDFGGPVSEKVAYRVSYSGEHSKGYYYDSKKRAHALYGAITYRPNDTYELFANSEIYWANYTENFGVNRVTQDLIDNGRYITGVNNNPAPAYVDGAGNPINFGNSNLVPAGPAAPTSDAQNSRWVVSGFPVVNRVVPTGTVDLDRRSRLLRPGDDSNGWMWNGQVIQTVKNSPTLTTVNNTYATFLKRDTLSSYHYSEIVDPAWSLENRTEFRFDLDTHQINTGVALRYQQVKAYNHFFFEPAGVWDLTQDRNFINVYNSVNFPDAPEVPGWEGRYATPGVFNGDTNESSAWQIAPFYQHDWEVVKGVNVLAGGRVDYMNVSAEDPLKPVFIPSAEDTLQIGLPNANISVSWRALPNLTNYVTYNYSQNYSGAVANGGGFGQLIDDGTGNYVLNGNAFRQRSDLWEAGAKASFLENKLFAGVAIFHQERSARQQDGSMREFTFEGIELEANWQPSKNFFMTVSYSYLDAVSDLPQFDVLNVNYYTGQGDLSDPANYAPLPGNTRFFLIDNGPGEYRIQGLPKNLFNFLAQYKFDNGFGLSLNGWIHDKINNNVAGTLTIPTQYQLDAAAFYDLTDWNFRLAAINITDEENWSPPNYVYGNESIQAEWPLTLEFTATYKF